MGPLRILAAAVLIAMPAAAHQARPANWVATVARTPEGGYRQGNPNAPIKIVEYGSRTCPTCGRFAAEGMEPLRREWIATGKASYEFRDMLVHGAPDLALALLNQCVGAQRFFPVLDAMFAQQASFDGALHKLMDASPAVVEGWQKLPPAQMTVRFAEAMGVLPFMRARGLTDAAARRCLADQAMIEGVAKVQAGARDLGVTGTPTFFVNGRRLRAYNWDQLQPELRAAE